MKSYKIKKGDHYAGISVFEKLAAMGWNIRSLSVKFSFHRECWWAPPRNPDDLDLNKLAGIGYGTNHHNNSVRLAWVPDFDREGMIKIFGYTYDERKQDPKFAMTYITSVHYMNYHTGKIESRDNKYFITVNGTTVEMENLNPDPKLCFRLYPYFGGNNTAPCDMVIELEMKT